MKPEAERKTVCVTKSEEDRLAELERKMDVLVESLSCDRFDRHVRNNLADRLRSQCNDESSQKISSINRLSKLFRNIVLDWCLINVNDIEKVLKGFPCLLIEKDTVIPPPNPFYGTLLFKIKDAAKTIYYLNIPITTTISVTAAIDTSRNNLEPRDISLEWRGGVDMLYTLVDHNQPAAEAVLLEAFERYVETRYGYLQSRFNPFIKMLMEHKERSGITGDFHLKYDITIPVEPMSIQFNSEAGLYITPFSSPLMRRYNDSVLTSVWSELGFIEQHKIINRVVEELF